MTNLEKILKNEPTVEKRYEKAVEYGFDMGYVSARAGEDASTEKGRLFKWLAERSEPPISYQ